MLHVYDMMNMQPYNEKSCTCFILWYGTSTHRWRILLLMHAVACHMQSSGLEQLVHRGLARKLEAHCFQ